MIDPKISGQHLSSDFHITRLGLPLLGTILKEQGHEVKIFVEEIKPVDWKDVEKADVACISTLTASAPVAYQYAQRIKEMEIPVVMGGVHATFCTDESLDFADYVVRHDGEKALPQLISSMEDGKSVEEIPNLSYHNNGKKVHNPISMNLPSLDEFPFPDLNLIEGWNKKFITPIETSRGCPFSCDFCSVHKMFRGMMRFRNIDSVVEELKRLKPRNIFFIDDNFALDIERTKKLLQLILDNFSKPPMWDAQVRIDTVMDKELLELIRKTRCSRLWIGFESINPNTLKEYNKRLSLEKIKEGITLVHKNKIKIHGMFIVGADTDNEETIHETIDFSKKAKIDSVQLAILTPLPGTSLYQRLQEENRLYPQSWKDWRKYDGTHVLFELKNSNNGQLEKELFKGLKDFYSIPEIFKTFLRGEFINAAIKWYGRGVVNRMEKINQNPVDESIETQINI